MSRDFVQEFKEHNREQMKKSRAFVPAMTKINLIVIGSFFVALDVFIGVVFSKSAMLSPSYLAGLIVLAALFSFLLAKFQVYDARKNGTAFILKRLRAKPPDFRNDGHRLFFEAVEKMKTTTGFPEINGYVVPSSGANSLALLESDGTLCVAMTEGMLAELSGEEIEAVAAREMDHLILGDALCLAIMCSLADFYEHLRDGLNSKSPRDKAFSAWFAAASRRALNRFVDPERELLADAAAVEMGHSPLILAQAIVKSFHRNSIEGFGFPAYAFLFFIPPRPAEEAVDSIDRPVALPPPLMRRIRRLADMAGVKTENIIC